MNREPYPIEKAKKLIQKYSKGEIKVSKHYLEYLSRGKREINEEEIKHALLAKDFYFAEKQLKEGEERYKLVYRLSNKYDLVIVVVEEQPQTLKVVTAYKTSKKVKEKWQKDSKLVTRK